MLRLERPEDGAPRRALIFISRSAAVGVRGADHREQRARAVRAPGRQQAGEAHRPSRGLDDLPVRPHLEGVVVLHARVDGRAHEELARPLKAVRERAPRAVPAPPRRRARGEPAHQVGARRHHVPEEAAEVRVAPQISSAQDGRRRLSPERRLRLHLAPSPPQAPLAPDAHGELLLQDLPQHQLRQLVRVKVRHAATAEAALGRAVAVAQQCEQHPEGGVELLLLLAGDEVAREQADAGDGILGAAEQRHEAAPGADVAVALAGRQAREHALAGPRLLRGVGLRDGAAGAVAHLAAAPHAHPGGARGGLDPVRPECGVLGRLGLEQHRVVLRLQHERRRLLVLPAHDALNVAEGDLLGLGVLALVVLVRRHEAIADLHLLVEVDDARLGEHEEARVQRRRQVLAPAQRLLVQEPAKNNLVEQRVPPPGPGRRRRRRRHAARSPRWGLGLGSPQAAHPS
mmetsp:Transcript_43870/g.137858  ORF Transcript_43870/g.137858 Transcript_43870/m.137858 type:complete len:458 (-) Transcript_43870:93-1466(-)